MNVLPIPVKEKREFSAKVPRVCSRTAVRPQNYRRSRTLTGRDANRCEAATAPVHRLVSGLKTW